MDLGGRAAPEGTVSNPLPRDADIFFSRNNMSYARTRLHSVQLVLSRGGVSTQKTEKRKIRNFESGQFRIKQLKHPERISFVGGVTKH